MNEAAQAAISAAELHDARKRINPAPEGSLQAVQAVRMVYEIATAA
jgi:hypothetical protein